MKVHPYIARSDVECYQLDTLSVRQGRLVYTDERPGDRDAQGVLWARQVMKHGQGQPVFGKIQVARQRHACIALLCQVCGGEPDENDDGILWLLPFSSGPQSPLHARVDEVTTCYPPICRTCCAMALRMCPPLRAGHMILRVTDVGPPAEVQGCLHDGQGNPVGNDDQAFAFDDPRLPLVLATHQLIRLHDSLIVAHA